MKSVDVDCQAKNCFLQSVRILDGPVNVGESHAVAFAMGEPFEDDCGVFDPLFDSGLVDETQIHRVDDFVADQCCNVVFLGVEQVIDVSDHGGALSIQFMVCLATVLVVMLEEGKGHAPNFGIVECGDDEWSD